MKGRWIGLTVTTLMITVAGLAQTGQGQTDEALAEKSGCFECHSIDESDTRLAFRNIAGKYKNDTHGYDLRLMSVASTRELPAVREFREITEDYKYLIIVALVGADLHIRIFDANGTRTVDKPEAMLVKSQKLTELKAQLNEAKDSSVSPPETKVQIIENALSVAGHTYRDLLIKALKHGGKGNWAEATGGALMPPYSRRLSVVEIKRLVDWVLSL